MADEVYVVTRVEPLPARYDLSEQDLKEMAAKLNSVMDEVGAEGVMRLAPHGGHHPLDVAKYPSLAAVNKVKKAMWELGMYRYWKLDAVAYTRLDFPF